MKHYPKWADTFTADSGKKWSTDPLLAKNAGKAGRINAKGKVYKNKDIPFPPGLKMRNDFYQGIDNKAMLMAFYAKFTQNPELFKLLIDTGDAELYHLVTNRGKPSELQHWYHLERVRECIKKYPIIKLDSHIVNKVLEN